jgi:hypothetical protein
MPDWRNLVSRIFWKKNILLLICHNDSLNLDGDGDLAQYELEDLATKDQGGSNEQLRLSMQTSETMHATKGIKAAVR